MPDALYRVTIRWGFAETRPIAGQSEQAKNASTSVEPIERFYTKRLPLSKEMAKNLQSFVK